MWWLNVGPPPRWLWGCTVPDRGPPGQMAGQHSRVSLGAAPFLHPPGNPTTCQKHPRLTTSTTCDNSVALTYSVARPSPVSPDLPMTSETLTCCTATPSPPGNRLRV